MWITFAPIGYQGQCSEGESLLDCARELGVDVISICGGAGTCCSCKVRVLEGKVSPLTDRERSLFSPEELQQGYRLACQTYASGDCRVCLPPESIPSRQRVQVEGQERAVKLDPPVRSYDLRLSPPSLSDVRSDAERLTLGLENEHGVRCKHPDIEVLRLLPEQLRSDNWQLQASVRNSEVIAVAPQGSRQLGLAVDLGTTKIAGFLLDLNNGKTLGALGVVNPQARYGEDVISRISYASQSPVQSEQLRGITVGALNQLINSLCAGAGARPGEVVEAVIVGNTAMHHLLLGLPVRQLGYSPFVPAVRQALDIRARDLGLQLAPGAYVHLPPNIAGFLGSDHIAMLLDTKIPDEGTVIAIDIGTNTEVSLLADGDIASASCASGPAFEGAHIKHGLPSVSGAIERLRIANEGIQFQTVDGAAPVGLCGSGIIDTVSQLYLAGLLDMTGRLQGHHPRLRSRCQQQEFVLVGEEEGDGPALVITQQDIRQLQLAKAAVRSSIQLLLETRGRSEKEISQVIIAGAFGSYIDLASAIAIGMLPPVPLHRIQQVGNAAGMGAKLLLLSREKRAEARELAARIHYVELATTPSFTSTMISACCLGQYWLEDDQRIPVGPRPGRR